MPMDPYQAFLVQRRTDLRRIARQTCAEHTAEDVEVEAWLIAERIATKRGFAINFSHRADQASMSGGSVLCPVAHPLSTSAAARVGNETFGRRAVMVAPAK